MAAASVSFYITISTYFFLLTSSWWITLLLSNLRVCTEANMEKVRERQPWTDNDDITWMSEITHSLYSIDWRLRVCSHCPTPRPIQTPTKNGLYRIVWRCSHCTDTDTDIDYYCTVCFYSHSRYVLGSRSLLVVCFTSTKSPRGPPWNKGHQPKVRHKTSVLEVPAQEQH